METIIAFAIICTILCIRGWNRAGQKLDNLNGLYDRTNNRITLNMRTRTLDEGSPDSQG